jgi:hypothetical protein
MAARFGRAAYKTFEQVFGAAELDPNSILIECHFL